MPEARNIGPHQNEFEESFVRCRASGRKYKTQLSHRFGV